MTPKQQRFVDEYLYDLNATQAAIRAGYSKNTAATIGYENLRKPEIERAIHEAVEARAKRTQITSDRVLHEIAQGAFSNIAHYISVQKDGSAVVDLSHLTAEQAAAIQEITSEVYMEGRGDGAEPVKRVKLKLHPKTHFLDLLCRHIGIAPERVEHSISESLSDALDTLSKAGID